LRFERPEHIYLGENVTINKFCWLGTYPQSNSKPPKLSIGDGSRIGHFNHITCINSVEIGPDVLTADKVHISDNTHGFDDPDVPIVNQPVSSRGTVVIGGGTWLGENVSVLSAKVGRNCVIGANAVVTSDIPDFCIAVGAPARIIKRFNDKTKAWEPITKAP
jgi:acetyltransferase-like isoleucine patch superfamily enzyme